MHRFLTYSGLLLLLAATLTVAGCGDGKLRSQGRVLKGGQACVADTGKGQFLHVIFVPVMKDGSPPRNAYCAIVDQTTGTFTAAGGDLRGIPPGKYRVNVQLVKDKVDLWKGKYSGDNAPTELEINSSAGEIVIDLDSKNTNKAS